MAVNRPQSEAVCGDGSGHVRQRPPHVVPGHPPLTAAAAQQQHQRLHVDVSAIAAHPRAACASERFLKNRSRSRQATRTHSTAFPNSRSRTPREHTHLPAMVGFVRKYVAQHFRPTGQGGAQASLRSFSTRPPQPLGASASISVQRAVISANPARACRGV